MRTKVYCFKPKGKGYDVYATKTYSGIRNSSGSSKRSGSYRRGGAGTDFVCTLLAKFVVHGLFGMKK